MLLALAAPDAFARTALRIDAASSHLSLAPHTSFYHDKSGGDDLAAVSRRLAQGAFQPLPNDNATFGFQDGAFWFHAVVSNTGNPEDKWLLVQEYALSDRIDVFAKYADGRVVHSAGGDHLPFDQRNIRYRQPNFWLNIKPGQTIDLLVRVQSESSMQVPLTVYAPDAFVEQSRDAQFAIG
ncbi:MAG: 7TM-DISM domain-containing protein, partial [Pseudoxanthomonas sp.]